MRYTIKIPIFKYMITVIFDEPWRGVRKQILKKWELDNDELTEDSRADGKAINLGDHQIYYLWFDFNVNKLNNYQMSVIIHECQHVVIWIMENLGWIEFNDEVNCYLLEYIIKKILDRVRPLGRGK